LDDIENSISMHYFTDDEEDNPLYHAMMQLLIV